jgi:cardiolipin synthase
VVDQFDILFFHVSLALFDIFVLLAISHMLRHQRSPTSTIAWMVFFIMVPYVGVPLYLMLGGRKAKKKSLDKEDLSLREAHLVVPVEHSRIDQMLRAVGIPGASLHNHVHFLTDPVQGFHGLLEVIDSAEHELNVATFIFGHDFVGERILEKMTEKAKGGVEVRLMVDAFGSLKTPVRFFHPFLEAGGKIAWFSPMLHLPFRRRANLRNHRKIAIADDRLAMVGGMNIHKEAICSEHLDLCWKDLSLLIEGPETSGLAQIFRSDWEFACGEVLNPLSSRRGNEEKDGSSTCDSGFVSRTKASADLFCSSDPERRSEVAEEKEPQSYGPRERASRREVMSFLDSQKAWRAVAQTVPSGPDVQGDPLYEALLTSIFDARERFWLVTPYFVPDEPLVQAMRIACRRGVDVRVIVPRRSNHFLADIARRSFVREIHREGGAVLYYEPGMLHAKAFLMDRHLAVVGSANVDMRSLFLNYEVMLFFYSEGEIQRLSDWFLEISEASEAGEVRDGFVTETIEGLTRMVSPML